MSVEAGHRSFLSELEDSATILGDGDTPIFYSFGSSVRLDGVSGLEGCVLAGSDASGFAQVPQVHGGREDVSVQGSLFWAFHCSTGFYQGHGSCVSYSSQDGGTASSVSRRLVASGFLTRAGSPCSEDSAPALHVSRDMVSLERLPSSRAGSNPVTLSRRVSFSSSSAGLLYVCELIAETDCHSSPTSFF